MTAIGTCTLRLARPRDARPLARMSRDYIEQGLTWRWREANLKQKINAPETVALVAELEVGGVQFIGGVAVMDFQLDKAQLLLLAVHPNLRRRNIGGQLIRWLHKQGKPDLDPDVLKPPVEERGGGRGSDRDDVLFDEASRLVVAERQARNLETYDRVGREAQQVEVMNLAEQLFKKMTAFFAGRGRRAT